MALIDMITDISSFDYSKVGVKQGEYFGEDKATGFTPNRVVGDVTEYKSSVFPPLGTTNYISPENPLEDLETIHILNPDGTNYFTPDHNPLVNQGGYTPTAVNYFGDENHPGFNLNISHGEDVESHYIIGSGNDFNFSEGSFTNMIDMDSKFSTGNFVSDMVDTDFDVDNFGSNLISINYSRIQGARQGDATNKPNLGDFGESHEYGVDGEEGKFHSELRLRDIDKLYEFKGGMAKALREPNNFGFDEPFIVHDIGDGYDSIGLDEGIFRGGMALNVVRTAEDAIRFSKWTLTGRGIIWNLKQSVLQAQNPIIENRIFNPLGVIGSIVPGLHLPRHTDGTFLDVNDPPKYDETLGGVNITTPEEKEEEGFLGGLFGSVLGALGVSGAGRQGNRLVGLHKTRIVEGTVGSPTGGLLGALGLGNNAFEDPKRVVDSTKGPFGGPIPMGDDRDITLITKQTDLTLFKDKVEKRKTYWDDLGEKGYNESVSEKNSQGEDLKTYLKDDYPTRLATKKDLTTFPSTVESLTIAGSNVFNKDSKPIDGSDFNLGTSLIKSSDGTKDGKLYSVGVSNTLQVPYGGKFDKLNWANTVDGTLPKDFIKFRIRDAVNGKWLVFPAHLGTITDTVTPTWTPEKYIGRPDSIHLYGGTDRSVSFDFKVAAFTKQEIPIIQEKMNYLVGLGYPTFKKISDSDDEERPVAPYIYLTIGDLFNNTPGYFSSIAITMEENATWEIDEGHQIPQVFSVSVEFVHVGRYLPHTLGKHYEVPWLKDKGVGKGKFGTFETAPRDGNTSRPMVDKETRNWSKNIPS